MVVMEADLASLREGLCPPECEVDPADAPAHDVSHPELRMEREATSPETTTCSPKSLQDSELSSSQPLRELRANDKVTDAACGANEAVPSSRRQAALKAALARVGGGTCAQALASLVRESGSDTGSEGTSGVSISTTCSYHLQQGRSSSASHHAACRQITLQQVLFDPAAFLCASDVITCGRIVVLDLDLKRIDITDQGAKLIVDIGKLDESSFHRLTSEELTLGSVVTVTGSVKKANRRTFMQARKLTAA